MLTLVSNNSSKIIVEELKKRMNETQNMFREPLTLSGQGKVPKFQIIQISDEESFIIVLVSN